MSTPASRVAGIMKGKTLAETMLMLAKKELEQMQEMLANVRTVRSTAVASFRNFRQARPPSTGACHGERVFARRLDDLPRTEQRGCNCCYRRM